jgi:glycosyltransferase involved in cell wall biosynthesis
MTSFQKPHICFVAPDTWPLLANDQKAESAGGAQVQQSFIAKGLARRGFRVSMICRDFGQPDGVTVDGVTVFKCHAPVQGPPVIRFFHPRLTGVWAALRRVDADIYYQRCAEALTGVTGLFSRRYDRRFVFAAACDLDVARDKTWRLFQRKGGWRDRQLFQLGLELADHVLTQHEGQARDYQYWYGRQPTTIANCYVAPHGHRADSSGVVLWASALRTGKRPELFLELARRLPHLRFRMVGGPSAEASGARLFEEIEEAARAIPNLEFVGFVPFADIDAHFNAARVFVNTSDYEGFPNTFLQSWSRGIPTVSFCDTGSRLKGEPVVTVTSDLNDMVVAVDRLMHEELFWRQTGGRAKTCYEKFHTADVVMDCYERVFASLSQPPVETHSRARRSHEGGYATTH